MGRLIITKRVNAGDDPNTRYFDRPVRSRLCFSALL
jgi:hypothetical protein